jgi:hypothetical protein
MLALQFGELPAFGSVVGKLIVGEDRPRDDVRAHVEVLANWMRAGRLRCNAGNDAGTGEASSFCGISSVSFDVPHIVR